ncbi:MAG: DUF5688 family protein [Hespellia sp.]|nr:DUF5688 family protein [Hespellia sp.]
MTYQEFKDYMVDNIKTYLPEKYQDAQVEISEVEKNNGLKLDGLAVRLPEQNMCPNIYLNQFYQDYEAGRDVEDILQNIAEIREMNDVSKKVEVEQLLGYDNIKDSIIFRVIGAKQNEGRLQNMPHRIEKDMALIYQALVQTTEDRLVTAQITNDMMDRLGVNENTLHEIAMINTQREFPMSFQPMEEVLKSVLRKDFMGINLDELSDDDDTKEFLETLFQEGMEEMKENEAPLYVLSNEQKMNGAAVLFYPEVQEEIAKQMGGDYFVLPSSIHEVLILRDDGTGDYQELKDLVNDVNETQVEPEEVLTGEVYCYDQESKQLMFASEKAERSQAVEKSEEKPSIMDTLKAKKEEAMQSISAPMGKMKAAEMEI